LSVLDLSPVAAGSGESQALRNTLDLARRVDRLGYKRYWLAEHHNIPSVASSAPEIMIAHVATLTAHLRVGSGGIMLPNHAPLRIAETFRVLEALHPGRIDLGLGRAPGSDMITALALRRSKERLGANDFPDLIEELIGFGANQFPSGHPFESVRAMPTDAPLPPIWILGSTEDGARIAADFGVGFAFAHHINPELAEYATEVYRGNFRASNRLDRPAIIVAVSVICADTDEEADRLAASLRLSWARLRTGMPGPLLSPEDALTQTLTPAEEHFAATARRIYFAGTPQSVKARLEDLAARTGAAELMIKTMTHSHAARVHSYELMAEAFGLRASRE
jgi:luciferase family oxidoreductase group 1